MSLHRIDPCPKPRMTRRDQWKPRAAAQRYFAFRDQVRLLRISVPEQGAWIVFHLSMPASWSEKKKLAHLGRRHQQKPDKDNLEKGLLDAVYGEDCVVWDARVTKLWAREGGIEIREEREVIEPWGSVIERGGPMLVTMAGSGEYFEARPLTCGQRRSAR